MLCIKGIIALCSTAISTTKNLPWPRSMTSLVAGNGRIGSSFVRPSWLIEKSHKKWFEYAKHISVILMHNVIISGNTMPNEPLPEWEEVIAAAAHLQSILPGAVLVGGSASAVYARH